MSGNSSAEKTEQPTQKKLTDARKKGQVPKSKEIVSACMISSMFLLLWVLASYFMDRMTYLIYMYEYVDYVRFDMAFTVVTGQIFKIMVQILVPFILTVVVVAVVSNFAQVGGLMAFEAIKPDLKKLNPIEGFKKLFKLKNFVELIKSIIKISVLSVLIYLAIRGHLNDMLIAPFCGEMCLMKVLGSVLKVIVIYTIIAFIFVGVADLFYQRWQFTKDNMMTKDEVKREYKQMEGDPQIKSKRKSFHRELLQEDQNQSVKSASALVTNPTHIAVALYYDEETAPLPVLFAKGRFGDAKKMRQYAEEANVPIIENVGLAHALYSKLDLFEEISYEFIEPVAKIMKWIKEIRENPERDIDMPEL